MAELRSVDPRTLKLNPDNPRRTAIPKEMDAQLVASIKAIGLLQPPVVREIDGKLVVRVGDRRTKAAISAGLKGAERIWGKPGKEDVVGHYVDPRTGAIETVAYRLPLPKKTTGKGGEAAPASPDTGETDGEVVVKLRPDVTQRGQAMIGSTALGTALPTSNLVGYLCQK